MLYWPPPGAPADNSAAERNRYAQGIIRNATLDAPAALREATAQAKILEAAKKLDKYTREISTRANRDVTVGPGTIDGDAQGAVQVLMNAVNAERIAPPVAGRDATVEAVKVALREATTQAKILEAVIKAEEAAKEAAQLANPGQVADGQAAAERVRAAADQARNNPLAGVNPEVAAVEAANRTAESEVQICNAIKRLHANRPLTIQADAQNLLNHLNNVTRPANPLNAADRLGPVTQARAVARDAAQGVENIINGRAINNADPRAIEIGNKAADAVDKVPQTLDGEVASIHAEFKHFLDGAADILRNKEVAKAISDTATTAAGYRRNIREAGCCYPSSGKLCCCRKGHQSCSYHPKSSYSSWHG